MAIDLHDELKRLQDEYGKAQQAVLRIQGAIVFVQKKIKDEAGSNGGDAGQAVARLIGAASDS